MDDNMNSKKWLDGKIDVSHNLNIGDRGKTNRAVYLRSGHGYPSGVAVDLSEAIEIHEHLGELIREVQEAQSKEPTAGELIRALEPGTAFKTAWYTYFRTSEGVTDPYGHVYPESEIDNVFGGKIEVL